MATTSPAGRRFFTDDEWKQIREGWVEVHEDTARTLRKVRKNYKRGSKMRKRVDIVMRHEEQNFDFDLRVLEALQEMDKILHPPEPTFQHDPKAWS